MRFMGLVYPRISRFLCLIDLCILSVAAVAELHVTQAARKTDTIHMFCFNVVLYILIVGLLATFLTHVYPTFTTGSPFLCAYNHFLGHTILPNTPGVFFFDVNLKILPALKY